MMLSKPKHCTWRNVDPNAFDLPIYNPNSAIGKRGHSRCRSMEKFVHLIPLIILICIFLLWCLSYPVNMEIRDGRFTAAAHQEEISQSRPVTERLIDHTILTVSTTPNASFPLMILMLPNINTTEAAPQPASESGTLVPSVLHVP